MPAEGTEAYEEWVNDCYIYALLNPSNNCTAMADVKYKEEYWQIPNHFFWLTRAEAIEHFKEAGATELLEDAEKYPLTYVVEKEEGAPEEPWEAPGDPYLGHVLQYIELGDEALAAHAALTDLWIETLPARAAYAKDHPDLHLMEWSAGVYQLKRWWKVEYPEGWKKVQKAYKALEEFLRPGVYTFRFLLR